MIGMPVNDGFVLASLAKSTPAYVNPERTAVRLFGGTQQVPGQDMSFLTLRSGDFQQVNQPSFSAPATKGGVPVLYNGRLFIGGECIIPFFVCN